MAERALNSGGHLSGFTTGLDSLNTKIGGLHKSDLVIVAGRPGMGKSALGTNMALAAAQRFLRDAEDGLEPAQVGRRAGGHVQPRNVGRPARHAYPRRAIRDHARRTSAPGKITQHEFRDLARAAAELQSLPLYIDDTPGLTIAALRTRARRLKRQKGIGMVIVDYLQLLQGTGRNSNENRVQEISEISRGLKQLAKELDVPVIGLSQLSRAVEQREDKRPQLSDLRESGSIEQDADIVLFIYREEYYVKGARSKCRRPRTRRRIPRASPSTRNGQDEVRGSTGKADVIVAKQRHGSTGIVRVRFDGRITKFSDVADDSYLPEMRS